MCVVLLIAAVDDAAAQQSALRIDMRCPKLTSAQSDELEARIRLLLGAAQGAPDRLELGCDQASAWITWSGERLPVVMQEPFADQFLDAVEARLLSGPRPPTAAVEAEPWPGESADDNAAPALSASPASGGPGGPGSAAAGGEAPPRKPADLGGGVALGVALEPPAASLEPVAGPYLEFGIPLSLPRVLGSPIFVSIIESARLGSAGPYSVMLLDFGAGLSIGAPLTPGARFGVAARFEAEWLITYPDGTSARAAFAPTATAGVRAAHDFGWTALWTEIAGRSRFSTLELRGPSTIVAADLAAQFTLGVVFLDRSPP